MKIVKRGETSDYGKFEMAVGNRVYKASHAAKIAKSIEENNMLAVCPIICIQRGNRLDVIDGQHRLGACKICYRRAVCGCRRGDGRRHRAA